jgi:hypothetical protein
MVMLNKIVLNGVDVTAYRVTWDHFVEWDLAIDECTIVFAPSLLNVVTVTAGLSCVVTRGFTTSTDEIVISGQITQIKPLSNQITVTIKGALYEAVKAAQTKSWDLNIDPEGGVGSEIFKDICDNSGLSYTPALTVLTDGSIINTGASTASKIVKFIQNDEDDFQKMNELAERYSYTVTYDYDNARVKFEPKGYTIYPVSLNTGVEIPARIQWKENMEQLCNKVKILGATVYDKVNPAVFAGPDTEFQLLKTPEDTEVRDTSGTGTLYVRGQKNIGTIGTDFDYYVDVEQKKIVFGAAKNNIWVRYGAQIPMPVVLSDLASINLYGGPTLTPHFKRFTYSDIKDVADAENRGRAILLKYSTPFVEAKEIPVVNSVIETNGNIAPGALINIIDSLTAKNVNVFVKIVRKSWPHIYDKITVGDEIWRTEDWQATQMKKINLLFNELNKNQDILIETKDFARTILYERRYVIKYKQSIAGDTLVWGHPTYGIWNEFKWGNVAQASFILGHPSYGILGTSQLGSQASSPIAIIIIQGKMTYKEYMYDTVFHDAVNSTATFSTVTNDISFTAGQVWYSDVIDLGATLSFVTLTMGTVVGTLKYEISSDNKATWQEISNTVRTAVTTSDGTGTYLRITENATAVATIDNTLDTTGYRTAPGIKLLMEE